MNRAKPLVFLDFTSPDNPLNQLIQEKEGEGSSFPQAFYVLKYLRTLEATKVIVEQNYFDRDYLEEYASFYSKSSRGYDNICSRIHFFSDQSVDRDLVLEAFSGNEDAVHTLKSSYLGFVVKRPIPEAPLGRTVLKWYDDLERNSYPRIIEPARVYRCNIGGITLDVVGLAWQQQDSAVAACATIGLWSLMHSSALSERHAIPTTSDITKAANKTDTVGKSTFPSKSLTRLQIPQAIKQLGFSPSSVGGNLDSGHFSKPEFASVCSAFLRSGYPLLLIGRYNKASNVGHAICAVGFRDSKVPDDLDATKLYRQDEYVEVIYIHDDNYGPNVRMELATEEFYNKQTGEKEEICKLRMKAPGYLEDASEATQIDKEEFIPDTVVAAVNNDLRTCPVDFVIYGKQIAEFLHNRFNQVRAASKLPPIPLIYSTRFIQLTDFISKDLAAPLHQSPKLLAEVRMRLIEELPPMSLHLAILRIATENLVLLDLIYDTTDSDRNRPVFGHIVYDKQFHDFLEAVKKGMPTAQFEKLFGKQIIAYPSQKSTE